MRRRARSLACSFAPLQQPPAGAEWYAVIVFACHHPGPPRALCRDIKPENLLIGHDGEIRMSDFGWSVEASGIAPRTTLCGTTDYLAPEMLNRTGHGLKTDVWCLGVLCYELLYGSPPFEEESLTSTCNRIRKVDFNFPTTRQVCAAAPAAAVLDHAGVGALPCAR